MLMRRDNGKKNKLVGIKLVGFIFILLSLFFAYLCYFFYRNPEACEIIFPPTINLSLAIVYLITGIGIFLIKKWFRILSIILLLIFAIYTGMYARLFLAFTVFNLFTLQPNTKIFINSPPHNFKEIVPYITIDITRDIIYPSICLLLIIISLFLIYYLTRPKIKEQFNKKIKK